MKNLKDKETFIVIIVLLIVFFPLAFIGSVQKIKERKENPLNNDNQSGYLYFYDRDNNYLGRYKCVLKGCEFVKSSEETQNINHYFGMSEFTGTIYDKYSFIKDNNKMFLYFIANEKEIVELEAIKYYDTTLAGNVLLTKKNGNWGVMSLSDFNMVIEYQFEYLGLNNRINADGLLKTDILIAKRDGVYFLIDNTGKVITSTYRDIIYDYNEHYLVFKNDDLKIYRFDGTQVLENVNIKNYYFYDNYLVLYYGEYLYLYNNMADKPISFESINNDVIEFTINDEIIKFVVEDEIIKLVEEN